MAGPETEEEERTQPGHSRRAEAPLSPAPTEAVGRTPRQTQSLGSAQQGAFQGREEPPGQAASPGTDDWRVRQRTHGIPRGGKPHLPMDAGHPGRRRWTPRPVPESSKPSLILLYAGKDDAGAPWMLTSMPTTRPSRSTFGQWTSGERVEILDRTCWEMSLTLRCAPWPCGGRPQLQDVEYSQTGWPAAGEGQSGADPVVRGPGAPGYGGHGQRQRAHAPTDVPDLAGLQGARSTNGPAVPHQV